MNEQAKQKAAELIERFLPLTKEYKDTTETFEPNIEKAKQCAIICCDEIINNFGLAKQHYCGYSTIEFYTNVKSEIEKY